MIKETPYFKGKEKFDKLSQKEKDNRYSKIQKWFKKNLDAKKDDKPFSLK